MFAEVGRKIKSIPSYFYRNYAASRFYSLRDRVILSRNNELKNKYSGRRCFIIGGGPSVAEIDLVSLKNEYTFVMSEFEMHAQYTKMAPKFHIISDSVYFSNDGTEYWNNRFKKKEGTIPKSTAIITSLGAKTFIEKNGLFRGHKLYYVGIQGIFTDKLPFNLNLDRYVPSPKNSVLFCLISAVWMGFNEIYLLGCEHNFLAQIPGSNEALFSKHGYEDVLSKLDTNDDVVLKKYLASKFLTYTYEMTVASVLQLFKNYRLFYSKARQLHPDLKIFNATPNSFLDVFPIINFEDIKLQV